MADLLDRLLAIDVFRVGEFRLKSGVLSPIYIDLRGIIAHPSLIRSMAAAIYDKKANLDLQTDVVCGVAYTALPIASLYSADYDVPMVLKRKEAKDYGTKKMVEGIRKKGENCLILEDIVSSGSSVIETAEVLRKEGLVVTDCIVFLNREQGGLENLVKAGIRLHYLFTLNDIFQRYCSLNNLSDDMEKSIKLYLEENRYIPVKKAESRKCLRFEERGEICSQPVAKRLLEIISRKRANLCVAVDSLKSKDLLDLADKLGPHVCMIKTHVDMLIDFDRKVSEDLSTLAKKHDFLIFEDRKFADIGNTVKNQYEKGLYRIHEWADIVTVHAIPGSGIIDALKSSPMSKNRACVLIAEMSSKGTLTDDSYQQKVTEMAKDHLDFVIGFVGQRQISQSNTLINFCPGINIDSSGDALGQQYKSPEEAIDNGADAIIVGRGICGASNPIEVAREYQIRAFDAYMKNV